MMLTKTKIWLSIQIDIIFKIQQWRKQSRTKKLTSEVKVMFHTKVGMPTANMYIYQFYK